MALVFPGILIYLFFTDEAYKFPLDAACKKKSEKELNEKDEERIGSVRALRKWALERQDWLKTPVGRYTLKQTYKRTR